MTDRAAAFAEDLRAGPAGLRRVLDAWEAPGIPAGRPLRFSGLGSSRYAAQVVAAELAALGRQAAVEWSSAPAPPDREAVIFAISSSGRTPEVVDTASRHRAAGGTVVAVTRVVDSPLAMAASLTLPLLVEAETSGIACTSFRATVAVLALATMAATTVTLRTLVDGLAATLAERQPDFAAWADSLDRAEAIDVIGDGRIIGALEQAALMLREAPRLRATAWDAGDWLHTGVYTALPGHRAVLFPGSRYDEEIVDTIRRRGGEVILLPAEHGASALEVALVGLAPVELLAVELWSRTDAAER